MKLISKKRKHIMSKTYFCVYVNQNLYDFHTLSNFFRYNLFLHLLPVQSCLCNDKLHRALLTTHLNA